MQTRMELEENQMKKYRWEQDQIAHMKVSHRYEFFLSYCPFHKAQRLALSSCVHIYTMELVVLEPRETVIVL